MIGDDDRTNKDGDSFCPRAAKPSVLLVRENESDDAADRVVEDCTLEAEDARDAAAAVPFRPFLSAGLIDSRRWDDGNVGSEESVAFGRTFVDPGRAEARATVASALA